MKPFYSQSILVECSAEELRMIRVALSMRITSYKELAETEEDKKYIKQMEKLYKDVTDVLQQMPWEV